MLSDYGSVLCLVHLLLSSTVGRADGAQELRNPAPDFSRHKIVQPVVLHARTKREISTTRDVNEAHHPEVTMSLPIDGEEDYIFDLRLNQDLITDNHVLSYQDNGRNVLHKPKRDELDLCHYGGSVRDKPGSWVAVSTCHGVQGIVFDGERMRYIEPAQGGGLDSQHYVYDHSDLIDPTLRGYVRNGVRNSSGPRRMKRGISRSKRSADSDIHEPYNANEESHYVELALVADSGLYRAHKYDKNAVHHQMLIIANYINALFSPLNIFVALVGVDVWGTDQITVDRNSSKTLANFVPYKDGPLQKKIPHDNAQLLVQQHFIGTTVGLGYVDSMCTFQSCATASNHTSNIGLLAMTMAHEMGHNFGMMHDAKCECKEKWCIMNEYSTFTSHWSSCSLRTLQLRFSKQREHSNDCLRNKPKSLFESPTCGNGFVEPGEQCDCGTMAVAGAYNPCHACCDPNTCMLRANATCGAGMCCDLQTCQLKSRATICRPAQECDLPEYCDGRSEYCPDDVYVMDATRCTAGGVMCMNKECVHPNPFLRPKSFSCPSGCSGRGVCNSQGHCHCDAGYGPPDCAVPGPGGSYDSGPATDTTSMDLPKIWNNNLPDKNNNKLPKNREKDLPNNRNSNIPNNRNKDQPNNRNNNLPDNRNNNIPKNTPNNRNNKIPDIRKNNVPRNNNNNIPKNTPNKRNNKIPDDRNNITPSNRNNITPNYRNNDIPNNRNNITPNNRNNDIPNNRNNITPNNRNNIIPYSRNNITPNNRNNDIPNNRNNITPNNRNNDIPNNRNNITPNNRNNDIPNNRNNITPNNRNNDIPNNRNNITPNNRNNIIPNSRNNIIPNNPYDHIPNNWNNNIHNNRNNYIPNNRDNIIPNSRNNIIPNNPYDHIPNDQNNNIHNNRNNDIPNSRNNIPPNNRNHNIPYNRNNDIPNNRNNNIPNNRNNNIPNKRNNDIIYNRNNIIPNTRNNTIPNNRNNIIPNNRNNNKPNDRNNDLPANWNNIIPKSWHNNSHTNRNNKIPDNRNNKIPDNRNNDLPNNRNNVTPNNRNIPNKWNNNLTDNKNKNRPVARTTRFMIAMYAIFLGITPALLIAILLFISRHNILQRYKDYHQRRLSAKSSQAVNTPRDPPTDGSTGGTGNSPLYANIENHKSSSKAVSLPIKNKRKIAPPKPDRNINKDNFDVTTKRDLKVTPAMVKTTPNEKPSTTDSSNQNRFNKQSLQTKPTLNESNNESDFKKSISQVKLKPIAINLSNENVPRNIKMPIKSESKTSNLSNEMPITAELTYENVRPKVKPPMIPKPDGKKLSTENAATKPPIKHKPNVNNLSKDKTNASKLSNENNHKVKPSMKPKPNVSSMPRENEPKPGTVKGLVSTMNEKMTNSHGHNVLSK